MGSTVHTPSQDRDFFTITIGSGQTLNAVLLSSYTTTDDHSFFGMTSGTGFADLGLSSLSGWALNDTPLAAERQTDVKGRLVH